MRFIKKRLLSFKKNINCYGTGFIGYHLACKLLKKMEYF